MAIDYKPEQNDYTNLTPFKTWLVNQINSWGVNNFPFLEGDFDKLTNYGMLMKMMKCLNDIIKNENLVEDDMSKLYQAFTELQNYINNYFDNLDVQDEINNKLDEMVTTGELQGLLSELYSNLRNEVNDTIEAFENTTNNNIADLTARINGVASGTPTPVSSISQMTDTTKTYVLTTNGYWYYYDGNNWVQGGIYQSTGIANDSVDILKLDNKLESNFTPLLSKANNNPIQTLSGWCRVVSNQLSIESDATNTYEYQIFQLKNNTIYQFYGWQFYDLANLIIVDSNDNNKILYSSKYGSGGSTAEFFNGLYKTPVNGDIKAYISYTLTVNSGLKWYLTRKTLICEYNDIKMNKNFNDSLNLMDTVNNAFINADNSNVVTPSSYIENFKYEIYSLKKGYTYKVHYVNNYAVAGLVISDLEYTKLYNSSEESIGAVYVEGDYTYIPTNDCYCFLSYTPNQSYQPSIELLLDENLQDKIGFNKWYAIGDSITEVNFRSLHNYLYWTNQDLPQLEIINLGVSGTGYKRVSGGNNTFINRLDLINSYNLENSIITVMGSINDMQYVTNNLGELGDTTTDTLYGSMYTFFNTLFTKFNGVRIGCISPINWKNSDSSSELPKYIKALKDTCELFNIPFLDLTKETNLRPNNPNFLNTYYIADGSGSSGQLDTGGVHPNSLGHKLMYGRIKEFIKSL